MKQLLKDIIDIMKIVVSIIFLTIIFIGFMGWYSGATEQEKTLINIILLTNP